MARRSARIHSRPGVAWTKIPADLAGGLPVEVRGGEERNLIFQKRTKPKHQAPARSYSEPINSDLPPSPPFPTATACSVAAPPAGEEEEAKARSASPFLSASPGLALPAAITEIFFLETWQEPDQWEVESHQPQTRHKTNSMKMKQIERQVPMFHGHYQATDRSSRPQRSCKEHRFHRAICTYSRRGENFQLQKLFFFNNLIQIVEGNEWPGKKQILYPRNSCSYQFTIKEPMLSL